MALICSPFGIDLGGRVLGMDLYRARAGGIPPAGANTSDWEDISVGDPTKSDPAEGMNSVGVVSPVTWPWGTWPCSPYIGFSAQAFRIPQLDRLANAFLGDLAAIDGVAAGEMIVTLADLVATRVRLEVQAAETSPGEGWAGPTPYYAEGNETALGNYWYKATSADVSGALQLCLVGYRERTVGGVPLAFPDFLGGGGGVADVENVATAQCVDCTGLAKAYLLNRAKYIGFGLVLIPAERSFESIFGVFETVEAGLRAIEAAYHQSTFSFLGWSSPAATAPIFSGVDTRYQLEWGVPQIGTTAVRFDPAKVTMGTAGLLYDEVPA